jgi:succinate-semialdehyde dehydrogenase
MSAISSLTHAISIDPYTGEQIGAYPSTPPPHWKRRCRAKVGYRQWRRVSLGQRSEYLLALAGALRQGRSLRADDHPRNRQADRPGPWRSRQVRRPVPWYAEHGPAMLAAEPTQVEKAASNTARWARSWP